MKMQHKQKGNMRKEMERITNDVTKGFIMPPEDCGDGSNFLEGGRRCGSSDKYSCRKRDKCTERIKLLVLFNINISFFGCTHIQNE